MTNKPNYSKKAHQTPKPKTASKDKDSINSFTPPPSAPTNPANYFKNNNFIVYSIIFLLSFGIYANSIPNLYCLDDAVVVTKNAFTKKGIAGLVDIFHYDTMAGADGTDVNRVEGGRYRPLSVATLAFEHEFFGENPHISHIVNILLYAFLGIFIFLVFEKLFSLPNLQAFEKKWYFSLSFIATILFLAHPVHTEAVANIKGRDEIMAMLAAFISMWFGLKYLDEFKKKYLLWSAFAFFCALLSKESAITFLAIIPLSIWFFTDKSNKRNFEVFVPLLVATAIFLLIRRIVIGPNATGIPTELLNNPFLEATNSQKFATIFYTLWRYIQIIIFPHPLTWDYYPYHIPLVDWADARAFLPLMLYVGMVIYSLVNLKKKNNILAFCILFFLATISIVSNLFFTVGVFMSERFVFSSTLGFCLIFAYLLVTKLPSMLRKKGINTHLYKLMVIPFLGIVLVLYSYKTVERNFDWKDNFTLFTHDAIVSKNSIKSLTLAGPQYVLKATEINNNEQAAQFYKIAKDYLLRANVMRPKHLTTLLDLGIIYEKYDRNLDSAIFYYTETIRIKPDYDVAFSNIEALFANRDSLALKFKTYKQLYLYNQNRFDVNYYLGSLYGAMENNLKKAIFHLEKAVQIDHTKPAPFLDLGVAYANLGDLQKAILSFEAAAKVAPKNPLIYNYIAECYRSLKQPENEKMARTKAAEIKETISKVRN